MSAIAGGAVMGSANMISLIIFIFVIVATSFASLLSANVSTSSTFRRYANLRAPPLA